MGIDSSANPETASQPKKKNCFLWGCLIVVILVVVGFCCLGSLIILPFVTDFDPLGVDLRDRIEEYIPWQEFLDDPSLIPGFEDFLEEGIDTYLDEDSFLPDEFSPESPDPSDTHSDASSIPMANYFAHNFPVSFLYPSGWDIETEDYAVTFYDPNSYTYLYVGEDLVDEGTTPAIVADGVLESLMEESQEGTFRLISSETWQVPTGEDAHLNLMEWTDLDGYYTWAYDLEIVNGESNVFFFISGEEPGESALYGDLLRIIVDSYRRE